METLQAGVDDAEELLALQRLAYQSEATLYANFNIPPLMQTVEALRADFATHTILKTVDQAQIVGSVRAYSKDTACYIGRLIVHPAWQQRGIGSGLMREIEACYPTVSVYRLFTGSRSEGNIRLYERLGYVIVHTEVIDSQLTLVHMEKQSAQSALA